MVTSESQSSSTSTSQLSSSVRVNVRLCGSVPRQEMDALSLTKSAPLVVKTSSTLNTSSYLAGSGDVLHTRDSSTHHTIGPKNCVGSQLCSQLANLQTEESHNKGIQTNTMHSSQPSLPQRRLAPCFDPPSWAVPAQGEARLEPVCDSLDRQTSVDLTKKSVFRIGRSPNNDVQLLHATSSRRHALLFHHSNGSCYLVDCGSAHGTYVNGVRVHSPPRGGVVVPHRVRRGSMVRFGGPGAPTYMLKSFAFVLDEMKDSTATNLTESPTHPSLGAVVQHNTRFNALGNSAKACLFMSLSSKRSFDSVETVVEDDYDPSMIKRVRCSSPLLTMEEPPLRLVSPDMNSQPCKRRRVTFSDDPPSACYPSLVSPDISSDENDNDCESV